MADGADGEYITPEELQSGIVKLRHELSRARQDSHSVGVMGRRYYGFASPHAGPHWQQCPAISCQTTQKVMRLTAKMIPKANNPYALRQWWKKQEQEPTSK